MGKTLPKITDKQFNFSTFVAVNDRLDRHETDPEITLLKGDSGQFASLYRHYKPLLYGIALSYLSDKTLAADAVQDVFLSLWNKRHIIEPRVLKPYLFQVTRNRCLDVLRQNKSHAPLEAMDSEPGLEDFTGHITAKETGQKARDLIRALSPQCRIVFLLVRFEKLSYRETSELLGISEKTVENHMGRALKTLKQGLDSNASSALSLGLLFIFVSDFQIDIKYLPWELGG